jgi:hypothetical protein
MTAFTAAVLTGNSQQFSASVCGATDPTIAWSATGGVITSSGVYTAPATPGAYKVTAKSVADPTKKSTTSVTVFSQIVADFGSRTGGVTVPGNMFGAQYVERLPASVTPMLKDAGFTGGRTQARLQEVYATQTPNWTVTDRVMTKYANAGISPIIEMGYAPKWLLPTNPCSVSTAPVDVDQWAQLAASYVAHVNQKFPGLVTEYEIWNEPSNTICGVSDPLATYINMYAAAAQAMHTQADNDQQPIRIGGPSSFSQPNWISGLLTNSATARYVDFVSYHKYGYGLTEINLGLDWDTSTDTRPLYSRTQSPSSGVGKSFKDVLAAANNGAVPVYITEYNDSAAFALTCCRNNPTYGPLWNALVVADLLNTVYSGAQAVPARMVYYAASGGEVKTGYFCLFGTYNSKMDCDASGGYSPYPQTYAYTLLASPTYLGLKNGGHMAASIAPPTTEIGLVPTAFYTDTKNVVVVVNPTPTTYPSLQILLRNTGISASSGTYYLLNSSNSQITTQLIALTPTAEGYTIDVSLPSYSVIGVSVDAGL